MIEVERFTPAQAARISGVNATLQRDWRRRKILPPLESAQASYSAFEVAKLMALGRLAHQGLSPLNFKGASEKLGAAIVYHALLDRAAFTGAFDDYLPNDIEGLLEDERIGEAHRLKGTRQGLEWSIEATRFHHLAAVLTKQQGHNVVGVGAFVQFAEGSFDFYSSPIEPFEIIEDTDPRRQGAIIVVDLAGMGAEFRRLAGPFAHVPPEYNAARAGYPWAKRVTAEIERLRRKADQDDAEGAESS